MVLRCSLLGHDYGEPEVEREREERGSEVVVTVAEYEECARCGERNVLSENTEVTSLPPESETSASASPSTSTSPSTEPETAAAPNDPSADGRDEPPSPEPGSDSAVDASDDLESEPDHPTDENGEPITDDAEILEDGDEDESRDPERERGEWPDSDDVGPPVGSENEPTAWPETDEESPDGESEVVSRPDPGHTGESDSETTLGFDASASVSDAADSGSGPGHSPETEHVTDAEPVEPTDDAVFVDADPESDASHPAADPDPVPDVGAEPGSDSDSDSNPGTGITSAQSAPAPGEGSSAPDGVPSEFYCPRCEFVAPGDRGSLRAGDICPDCRKGYLGERERERER